MPCTGYGPQPAKTQALVIVTVEFDGPSEAMTFTILVPNDGDEGIVREQSYRPGAGSREAVRRSPQEPIAVAADDALRLIPLLHRGPAGLIAAVP